MPAPTAGSLVCVPACPPRTLPPAPRCTSECECFPPRTSPRSASVVPPVHPPAPRGTPECERPPSTTPAGVRVSPPYALSVLQPGMRVTPPTPHMSRCSPGCKCPPVYTPRPARGRPSAALAGAGQSGGTVGRPGAGRVPPRGSTGHAAGTGQQAAEVAASGPVEVAEVDGHKQEDKEPIEPHEGQGHRVPAGWGTSGGGSHDPPVAQW